MPTRASRPCPKVERGRSCPHLQPCPVHVRKPWAHAEPSRHARGYTAAWDRRCAQVLREEPICRDCRQEPSTTVDHRIPKAEGGTDDRANLAGLCKGCQGKKAGREGGRASARARE